MHYFCFKIKYISSHTINNASLNNDEIIIINLVLDTFMYANITRDYFCFFFSISDIISLRFLDLSITTPDFFSQKKTT